ncbi:pentapeptide repeat-containing protein [Streptomyces sp. NPDC018833]|uniref:pentapeptide repeat-containing protein n=1 Tax=Streptomyces sp. NPDC018833 TaxID=3365053 RepID=UPI003792908A
MSEVEVIVGQVVPVISAAVGAYGAEVLTRAQDAPADATMHLGPRILARLLHHAPERGRLESAVADLAVGGEDPDAVAALRLQVRRILAQNPELVRELAAMLPLAPQAGGSAVDEATWWARIERAVGLLASTATLAVATFAWISIQQVNSDQEITRDGQITDRYNTAMQNLGSDSLETRLGSIYGLQRILEDSPRDERTVVRALSAFIRTRSTTLATWWSPTSTKPRLGTDIAAALSVLSTEQSKTSADLTKAYLAHADLRGAHLARADLTGADLTGADLTGADLQGAHLAHAYLQGAHLARSDLRGADLTGAKMDKGALTYSQR